MTRSTLGTTRTALGLTAFAALLAACGGGATDPYGGSETPTAPGAPGAATVAATPALAFTPASLTVAAGATVTFAFGRTGHNVYFDPVAGAPQPGAPADIAGENANVAVARAFPAAGTYRYTCHIHPVMHGTIVVQAAGTDARSGGP